MKFRVSHKPGVLKQIAVLHEAAKAVGIEPQFVDALRQIVVHLQTHPLQWGDPEYNLIHEGGVVCHGIVEPLTARFAVYEIEEAVYILEIRPLPNSLLAK